MAAFTLGLVHPTDAFIIKVYNQSNISTLMNTAKLVSPINPYPYMYFRPSIPYVQSGYQFFTVNARPNYPGTYAVRLQTRTELLTTLNTMAAEVNAKLANPNLTRWQRNQLLNNLNNINLKIFAVTTIQ